MKDRSARNSYLTLESMLFIGAWIIILFATGCGQQTIRPGTYEMRFTIESDTCAPQFKWSCETTPVSPLWHVGADTIKVGKVVLPSTAQKTDPITWLAVFDASWTQQGCPVEKRDTFVVREDMSGILTHSYAWPACGTHPQLSCSCLYDVTAATATYTK